MSVEIVEVTSRRQLRRFIRFGYDLYRGNRYAVPDLFGSQRDAFTPGRNAALDFCDLVLFLAVRDGVTVGRTAGIINRHANEKWGRDTVRFGWIDFIDDREVSRALLDAVAAWGRSRGMTEIEGPFGFTDFDPEGMLVDGFDQLGTMATIYNYPYYSEHIRALGMECSAEWVEWSIPFDTVPEKMGRLAGLVLKRYNLHVAELGSKSEEATRYACRLFELVNVAYSPLYGFSEFSQRQIEDFVRRYLPLLDMKLVTFILDGHDELVAAGLVMHSLSRALQKARGRLFPFGWWHLFKVLKVKPDEYVDMLFLAIRPDYQNKGLNAVMFDRMIPVARSMGMKLAESNPELVTNSKMQAHWQYFEGAHIHKRRCVFRKDL
ncbi:MAG: N-acetyltransferase [Bacteroidaceae bacterium]|nr:N-acetyltransferase [Bacteroidaceae bacterium]